MYDDSPANVDRKYCAQATLYTVLEQFLRLMHPLMPFVTEELWQRLPNRELLTDVPSIMIAPYPTAVPAWRNPEAEAQMDVVKEAIHGARSLRSDYRVANHIKADFSFRSEVGVRPRQLNAGKTRTPPLMTLFANASLSVFAGCGGARRAHRASRRLLHVGERQRVGAAGRLGRAARVLPEGDL
jgi:hypothetical protein